MHIRLKLVLPVLMIFIYCVSASGQRNVSNQVRTLFSEWIPLIINGARESGQEIKAMSNQLDWNGLTTFPLANSNRFLAYIPVNNQKKNLAFEVCINPDSLLICYGYIVKIEPEVSSGTGTFLPSVNFSGTIQRYFLNNTLSQINEYKEGVLINEQRILVAGRWINPFHIFKDRYVIESRDILTGEVSSTFLGSVRHKSGLTDSINFNGDSNVKMYDRDDVFGRINGRTLANYSKHPGPGSIGDVNPYFQEFDKGGSRYSIAVMINQPVLHTDRLFNKYNFDVGHNYLVLRETKASGLVITKYAGFYPLDPADPIIWVKRKGDLNDDKHSPFSKGFSWQVSEETFFSVLNNIKNYAGNEYNLFEKNCVNFVFDVLKQPCRDFYPQVGIVYYPVSFPIYHGLSPGSFGEKVERMSLPAGAMIFPGNKN